MNCQEAQQELLKALDAERPAPQPVQEHVRQCSQCREFGDALGELVPPGMPVPSVELDDRVLGMVHRRCHSRTKSARAGRRVRRGFRIVRWAAAAAVVALLAVAVRIATQGMQPAHQVAGGRPEPDERGGGDATPVLAGTTFERVETELLSIEAAFAAFGLLVDDVEAEKDADVAAAPGGTGVEDPFLQLEAQLLYVEEAI